MKNIKLDFGGIQKLKKYIKKYYILIILNILLATMSSLVSSAPIMLIQRLFDKGIAGKNEKDIIIFVTFYKCNHIFRYFKKCFI